jgi:hypothetical protein
MKYKLGIMGSKRIYTPKEVVPLALSFLDSINPIIKGTSHHLLHWRYKIVALGNVKFRDFEVVPSGIKSML